MATVTSESPLQAAERIATLAAELAPLSERRRSLEPQLVQALSRADLFRLCVPTSVGGGEAHPSVLVQSVEALARGDGAAGWCVAVGATSGLLGGYLPEPAARRIFGTPGAIAGGVFAPRGRAVAGADGFLVSGRWPFASGCQHCDWLMGGSVVNDAGGDGVRRLANGMPDVRLMLAPAAEVLVHDTWQVSGLRGTGSHDIEFQDVRVPLEHSASVFSDSPLQPGPLYAFPLFGLLAVAIAGTALGIARGAVDDLLGLAQSKRPAGGQRRLAERPTVQSDLAQAEASLRAARVLLLDAVDRAWEHAAEHGEVSVAGRTALRLASTHATVTAAETTGQVYRLSGASAIYETSALQRRFRDVNVATQHMVVAPATWELTGRLLLGEETDVTQL